MRLGIEHYCSGMPRLLARDAWPGCMKPERNVGGMLTGQGARGKCHRHKGCLKGIAPFPHRFWGGGEMWIYELGFYE